MDIADKLVVDDFIQMLLTFPIDPPASSRPEVLEIISDSVYANSSTLDGRRFAQEFFTRRKADAARPNAAKTAAGFGSTGISVGGGAAKITTAADVVKIVPKKVEAEAGFKIVKAKGRKRT
jgi:PERQ amino acid-rich with GYF domain-containing protein